MKIEIDKQLHLLGGVFLAQTFGLWLGPLVGFLLATSVGLAKEIIWDGYFKQGTVDKWDAVATIGGGALGSASLLLVTFLG